MSEQSNQVIGMILAGGQSRRMGGREKAFIPLAGRPLLAHVLDRIGPGLAAILLNANGDPARFDAFSLPVRADVVAGFAGPLAGILTGLEWAAETHPGATHLLSAPCDAPFVPADLAERLWTAMMMQGADMAMARSAGRDHPVAALWPVAERAALRHALVEEDIRKIDRFTGRYRVAFVDFATEPVDPFFNINSPEDLAAAEDVISRFINH